MSSSLVSGPGGLKDLAIGVTFLFAVGTAFTGVVALVAAVFTGH